MAQRAQHTLGHTLAAVRLDSGDLVSDSQYVREQLVAAGMGAVRILASGDLDEFEIARLLEQGAQVDAFGVGTALGAGLGDPEQGIPGGALGGVYKEVSYVDGEGVEHPRLKLAGSKTTWPGRKEVYRHPTGEEDVIQLEGEPAPEGYLRLLRPVMRNGRLVPGSLPPLSEVWELAQANLAALPEQYRALLATKPYPVRFSAGLQRLRAEATGVAQAQVRVGALDVDAAPDGKAPEPKRKR